MYLSDTLVTMLGAIRLQSDIAYHLYNRAYYCDASIGDYFDYVPGKGMISFLPKARIERMLNDNYHNVYTVAGRQETRIGRAVRAMMENSGLTITDSDVEQFTNLLRAQDTSLAGEFSLVEGEDIRKWYNGRRYAPRQGSLNQSCMRYARNQSYFDLYVNNPDTVKLLIMKDKDSGKLLGRALVWFSDEGTFMDRVYGTDLTIAAFRRYGIDKGWYVQNGYNGWLFNNERVNKTIRIELAEWEFAHYPYMDTAAYLDFENGVISNVPFDRENTNYLLSLHSTEGYGHAAFNPVGRCNKCSRYKRTDCGCAYCDYCPSCATLLPANGVCTACRPCRSCGTKDTPQNMLRMSSGWECSACTQVRVAQSHSTAMGYYNAPSAYVR